MKFNVIPFKIDIKCFDTPPMMLRRAPLEPLVNFVNLPFLVSFGKFGYVRLVFRQI